MNYRRVAVEDLAYAELPIGIDLDLFRGPLDDETAEERSVRLVAARDILAELRELGQDDEITALDASYAAALTHARPLRSHRRTADRRGAAA